MSASSHRRSSSARSSAISINRSSCSSPSPSPSAAPLALLGRVRPTPKVRKGAPENPSPVALTCASLRVQMSTKHRLWAPSSPALRTSSASAGVKYRCASRAAPLRVRLCTGSTSTPTERLPLVTAHATSPSVCATLTRSPCASHSPAGSGLPVLVRRSCTSAGVMSAHAARALRVRARARSFSARAGPSATSATSACSSGDSKDAHALRSIASFWSGRGSRQWSSTSASECCAHTCMCDVHKGGRRQL
mmetsp:Transcript_12563/g.41420  ORF Transcript_12563/g.41420 Transcript_12563/m.41420 type:complete len:249 (-) Transcript_12563:33-779(-)